MMVSGIPPAVYVQVIIRCITAKAGRHGEFRLPMFLFLTFFLRIILLIFCFFQDYGFLPLETRMKMGYNTGVYA